MAVIKKDGNFMGLPMNVARGNPIPLDKSEIWYSYEAMELYAQTDPVAYVGQILGLVDEAAGTATAYIILNTAGELQEIGASVDIPSLKGDNASVIISNEIIALKNWGIQYYKYVEATGTEGEDDYVEAHYELQIVDDENPWIIGLEPKVASENGQIVLAWYQPNPTTIEGLGSQVSSLQTAVGDLQKNTYTKTEVDKKIADAGHLKRIIVDSVDDIDVNAADADQYIYMVLTSPEDTADKYDEYMVIIYEDESGTEIRYAEKVGSWEVDLSNYVTKAALQTELDKKVDAKANHSLISDEEKTKLAGIEDGAQKNYITSVDSQNFTVEAGKLLLQGITVAQVQNLQSLLDAKVNTEAGKGLSSNDFTDDYIKIIQGNTANIQTQGNKIITIESVLNDTEVDGVVTPGLITKVNNLSVAVQTNTDNISTNASKILTLEGTVTTQGNAITLLQTDVADLKTKVNAIDLTKYVTTEIFQATVGNLEELQQSQTTLHTQVKEIQEAITWGELDETTT